ncbi:uncharacterized protein UTRI_01917 [Ustilago trichophora]|uniref:EF-hand domain-containing protein n=1 Tax=Ustilago trichophora TaxID=86804 RepID=A0A5C3E1E3_9BASI|nr:uncharacterized protein UTRI_01917 [Ustilago trichophora]
MKWLIVTTAIAISLLALSKGAHAQHRMVRMHARQQPPAPQPGAPDQKLPHQSSPGKNVPQPLSPEAVLSQPAAKVDPGLKLTQDSDADMSLQHEEAMRLLMQTKAEAVIASHAGDALSPYEIECILNGVMPSLHPGSLPNVTWTMDMYESGTTLPTTSSSSKGSFSSTFSSSHWSTSSSTIKLMSTASDGEGNNLADAKKGSPDIDAKANSHADVDDRDLNHDGIISVDELLHSFFHADDVKNVFDKVQAQTDSQLGKDSKKEIIKKAAPVLHMTIEKVASHRGWGLQDARFAQLHIEGQGEGAEAFKDYNTFVKTMRSALITPKDAAKHSAQEQQDAPRTDPATKA